MALNYTKCERMRLRDLGFDEKWLQQRLREDPSLLGMGDLSIARKERSQPTGGRCDFLMIDSEEEIWYEIEIMLGQLDPSHIIRSIEYWEVERTRYPKFEHRAVIVAEKITSRFFNVIRLLNRAVPIIAIQLEALKIENLVTLCFTKVLDISELYTGDEEDEVGNVDTADRTYWQQNEPEMLSIVDKLVSLIAKDGKRVTYNRGHIALGTSGNNFAWFHPRKNPPYCKIELKMDEGERMKWLQQFAESGISPNSKDWGFSIRPTNDQIAKHEDLLREAILRCEELSR